MNLSMQEAVATLQSMFSNIDRETIVEVLRSQRGHMERTVEILLEFQGEDLSHEPPLDTAPAPPPQQQYRAPPSTSRQQAARPGQVSSSSSSSSSRTGAAAPNLPSDFLSVDRYDDSRPTPSSSSPETPAQQRANAAEVRRQMEADEALARALQNRLFLSELRQDPAMQAELRRNQVSRSGNSGGAQTTQDDSFSADSVLTGMKTMGEAAKRKLSLMARTFNSRIKGDLSQPSATHYRSLPGDDDDDDPQVIAFENSDRADMARRPAAAAGGDDDDDVSLEDRRSRVRHRDSQRVTAGGESSKKDD